MKKIVLLICAAIFFASLSGEESVKNTEKNYSFGLFFPFFSNTKTKNDGEMKLKNYNDETVTIDTATDSSETVYGIEFMEPTFVAGKKIAKSAWLTASFSLKKNSSDSKDKLSYDGDTKTASKENVDETTFMISFGLKYDFMIADDSSSLFINPEIAFAYMTGKDEDKITNNKKESSGTGYGASLKAGYEKFISENVSLGFYGLYTYLNLDADLKFDEDGDKYDSTVESKSNMFELGLLANVYF